ncbi:hypothetical protein ACIQCG_41640 [Streptomyces noursei]|uniref:hypothetical protein n=1 Tax=Streptomyces noursei TaxID=1971 RepID=UPI0037F5DE2A
MGPAPGLLTDTAPPVAALALEVCQELLANGTLALAPVTVRLCRACDHMTGEVEVDHGCRACTAGAGTRTATRRLLVHDRPGGRPVLEWANFHVTWASTPAHLVNVAHNAPRRLLLSRTRAHGISLSPLGLDDMVLDPRFGLHLAVLAAAAQRGEDRPVMTLTPNAAANVAVYGAPVRRWGGMQLRYALHGRIPYDEPALRRLFEVHRVTPQLQILFTHWYLPLCVWHERAGIAPARVSSLLKFLRRVDLARPDIPENQVLAELRGSVEAGDPTSAAGMGFRIAAGVAERAKIARGPLDPKLLERLQTAGVGFSRADTLWIIEYAKPGAPLAWLEKGNVKSGQIHTLFRHAGEFAKAGVRVEDIPALLKKALTEGTLLGTQGSTRLVYEVVFNGKSQRVAIDVSSNGFVIGANPA